MTETEIQQALARGYCSFVNENKILDPDLIKSMAEEVIKLQEEKEQIAIERETLIWLRQEFTQIKCYSLDDKRLVYLSIAMNHITDKYANHKEFGIPDWDMSCLCDECKSSF